MRRRTTVRSRAASVSLAIAVLGAAGCGGFDLGRRYKPAGCIQLEPVTLGLIGAKPSQFWLNIHNARYPAGAVRGPLGNP
jgi:hypothetical protein